LDGAARGRQPTGPARTRTRARRFGPRAPPAARARETLANADAQGTYGNDGSVNYSAHITFMNWRAAGQNVVLNGTLADQLITTINGSTSTINAKYTGGLALSGAINGMVDYDLSLKASTSSSGACVTESGSVGGYSIDIKTGC
jgi:hypothetical protein